VNSGLRQYELCGMVSGLHIYFMLNFTTFVICVALTPYAPFSSLPVTQQLSLQGGSCIAFKNNNVVIVMQLLYNFQT